MSLSSREEDKSKEKRREKEILKKKTENKTSKASKQHMLKGSRSRYQRRDED
jgi:hypothetical protein